MKIIKFYVFKAKGLSDNRFYYEIRSSEKIFEKSLCIDFPKYCTSSTDFLFNRKKISKIIAEAILQGLEITKQWLRDRSDGNNINSVYFDIEFKFNTEHKINCNVCRTRASNCYGVVNDESQLMIELDTRAVTHYYPMDYSDIELFFMAISTMRATGAYANTLVNA